MRTKSDLNIYWNCATCGSQVPGEHAECPQCASLTWRVEETGAELLLTVIHRHKITILRRIGDVVFLGERALLAPISAVSLQGRYFEVYGWLEWRVVLKTRGEDIVIAEGKDDRPAQLVGDLATLLSETFRVPLREEVSVEWGTW